ncbi:MAG: hypothetical protein JSW06_03235 [Thermoplasmatales archaeon]|nr:MAG: hypothetical protein JSW06_03235 [Thermoplasmatales archaeon]
MKNKIKGKNQENTSYDDLFDLCIEKGLIEKTESGYYFKSKFFETLEIYEE